MQPAIVVFFMSLMMVLSGLTSFAFIWVRTRRLPWYGSITVFYLMVGLVALSGATTAFLGLYGMKNFLHTLVGTSSVPL